MRLLYFADPMCAWCYGFGPELRQALAARPGQELQMVMGGLRTFNREPMSEAFRAMLREHWEQVARESGLGLNAAALDAAGFAYDTEPACRAVVTARSIDESRAFDYCAAIQAAFHRDGVDVTREENLVEIARATGYDASFFAATVGSQPARRLTLHDFETSERLGVTGFPTLAARYGEDLYLVSSGYVKAAVLADRLAEIERRVQGGAS